MFISRATNKNMARLHTHLNMFSMPNGSSEKLKNKTKQNKNKQTKQNSFEKQN